VRRRELLLSGAAALLPLTAIAQQSRIPVVGFLNSGSPEAYAPMAAAFRKGLAEDGYVENQNVLIDYRWAEGHYDRLPSLTSDLVSRKVAAIFATGSAAPALAAKAATSEIPIVFASGSDPVRTGLVASLNHPGGNITGISIIFTNLVPKRLEFLSLLVSQTERLGAIVNPNYPEADFQKRELEEAAAAIHKSIEIVAAAAPAEIDAAFHELVGRRIHALLVGNDPYFLTRGKQFAALAMQYGIPGIYSDRSYLDSGGLMSYGPSLTEVFRQAGLYTARILRGEKPADLPVMQPTKFELVINLKTAKALGLTVPQSLLARADEVIE
jgi:putative tryptophan/tyrosine transport system substrate-binding protein